MIVSVKYRNLLFLKLQFFLLNELFIMLFREQRDFEANIKLLNIFTNLSK